MIILKTAPTVIASTLLLGCGGSSQQTFPVRLDPLIDVVVTEDTLSIDADGREISVPLIEGGVTEGFEGGLTSSDLGMTGARFRSDVATATIGSSITDDTFTLVTSFERLEAIETLPVGQATATGTVVSVLAPSAVVDDPNTEFDETATIFSQINETIVLNVDFDDSTIDGQINTVTADLFGLGLPFVLSEEINSINLLETQIQGDGSFDGVARYTNEPMRDDGTYGGLIAGEGGSTVVGSFDVPGRTGVFQATSE